MASPTDTDPQLEAHRAAMRAKPQDATLEGSAAILRTLLAEARTDRDNATGGSDLDIAEQRCRELTRALDGITNALHPDADRR